MRVEKIIVVYNPSEGVIERDYAVGERRNERFYQERRERGWMTLNERLASREAANPGDDKEARDD